jgi:dCTP deaminase
MIVAETELAHLVREGLATRFDSRSVVVEPTSVGLHLGSKFLRYRPVNESVALPSELATENVAARQDGSVDFPPGTCVLGCTLEHIRMPLGLMGFIQTKGTIARGFVVVHLCDGQVDPGFEGCITLELVNLSNINYILRPGIPIAQLFVHRLSEEAKRGYSGRYQSSYGPTAMRGEARTKES